jgi:hypothetical protein
VTASLGELPAVGPIAFNHNHQLNLARLCLLKARVCSVPKRSNVLKIGVAMERIQGELRVDLSASLPRRCFASANKAKW